jgi:hypothetical protein
MMITFALLRDVKVGSAAVSMDMMLQRGLASQQS